MGRPHRQRFVFMLLTVLVVAVLALAIAQSAHLQSMHPSAVVMPAIASLLQPAQSHSRLLDAVPSLRRLPCGVDPLHFPMPPPGAA